MADKAAVYRGQQSVFLSFLFMSTTLWKRFPVNFFSVERVVMFQRFRALFGKRVPKPLSGLLRHVDLGLKYSAHGSIIPSPGLFHPGSCLHVPAACAAFRWRSSRREMKWPEPRRRLSMQMNGLLQNKCKANTETGIRDEIIRNRRVLPSRSSGVCLLPPSLPDQIGKSPVVDLFLNVHPIQQRVLQSGRYVQKQFPLGLRGVQYVGDDGISRSLPLGGASLSHCFPIVTTGMFNGLWKGNGMDL